MRSHATLARALEPARLAKSLACLRIECVHGHSVKTRHRIHIPPMPYRTHMQIAFLTLGQAKRVTAPICFNNMNTVCMCACVVVHARTHKYIRYKRKDFVTLVSSFHFTSKRCHLLPLRMENYHKQTIGIRCPVHEYARTHTYQI